MAFHDNVDRSSVQSGDVQGAAGEPSAGPGVQSGIPRISVLETWRTKSGQKLIEGANVIGNSNLIIDDKPGISISELRSKCRKYKMEHNLGIIFIDYLQLMTGSGRSESRQQKFQRFPVL